MIVANIDSIFWTTDLLGKIVNSSDYFRLVDSCRLSQSVANPQWLTVQGIGNNANAYLELHKSEWNIVEIGTIQCESCKGTGITFDADGNEYYCSDCHTLEQLRELTQ